MVAFDVSNNRGIFLFLFWLVFFRFSAAANEYGTNSVYGAVLNITYWDPSVGEWRSRRQEQGFYAMDGRLEPEWGRVVHVRTAENRTDGCGHPVNIPPSTERWIALVEKGSCGIQLKIINAVAVENISAVVVYGHDVETEPLIFKRRDDIVVIFISRQSGEQIVSLAENASLKLMLYISLGRLRQLPYNHINKTSVLFVSISFIVLMVISLAWLIFYYIQRLRYTHTKDRLTKRLMNAAKKALNRIPQKTLRKCDIELEPEFDLCAICVENYKVSDVIRILSCRHVFHKSCVDPWLLEQRTCPICKLDILQAYGIQVLSSQEPVSMSQRPDTHPLYLEASSLLRDETTQRHSVELALLCPRLPPDDSMMLAEFVSEVDMETIAVETNTTSTSQPYQHHHQTLV